MEEELRWPPIEKKVRCSLYCCVKQRHWPLSSLRYSLACSPVIFFLFVVPCDPRGLYGVADFNLRCHVTPPPPLPSCTPAFFGVLSLSHVKSVLFLLGRLDVRDANSLSGGPPLGYMNVRRAHGFVTLQVRALT